MRGAARQLLNAALHCAWQHQARVNCTGTQQRTRKGQTCHPPPHPSPFGTKSTNTLYHAPAHALTHFPHRSHPPSLPSCLAAAPGGAAARRAAAGRGGGGGGAGAGVAGARGPRKSLDATQGAEDSWAGVWGWGCMGGIWGVGGGWGFWGVRVVGSRCWRCGWGQACYHAAFPIANAAWVRKVVIADCVADTLPSPHCCCLAAGDTGAGRHRRASLRYLLPWEPGECGWVCRRACMCARVRLCRRVHATCGLGVLHGEALIGSARSCTPPQPCPHVPITSSPLSLHIPRRTAAPPGPPSCCAASSS